MISACTRLLRGAGYVAFDGETPAQPLHSALNAEYAHVTAPLRRLGDRYASEICVALCAGTEVPDWVHAALPDLAKDDAGRPRSSANRYERMVLDLVEAGLLQHRVGESFDGGRGRGQRQGPDPRHRHRRRPRRRGAGGLGVRDPARHRRPGPAHHRRPGARARSSSPSSELHELGRELAVRRLPRGAGTPGCSGSSPTSSGVAQTCASDSERCVSRTGPAATASTVSYSQPPQLATYDARTSTSRRSIAISSRASRSAACDGRLATLAGAAGDRPGAALVRPAGPELEQHPAAVGHQQPGGPAPSPVRVPVRAGGPAHGSIVSVVTSGAWLSRDRRWRTCPRWCRREEWLAARRSCWPRRRRSRGSATGSTPTAGGCRWSGSTRTTGSRVRTARSGLLDLFDGRPQLVLHHFMFGPGLGGGLPELLLGRRPASAGSASSGRATPRWWPSRGRRTRPWRPTGNGWAGSSRGSPPTAATSTTTSTPPSTSGSRRCCCTSAPRGARRGRDAVGRPVDRRPATAPSGRASALS